MRKRAEAQQAPNNKNETRRLGRAPWAVLTAWPGTRRTGRADLGGGGRVTELRERIRRISRRTRPRRGWPPSPGSPEELYFGGGTAAAVHLGHGESRDLDSSSTEASISGRSGTRSVADSHRWPWGTWATSRSTSSCRLASPISKSVERPSGESASQLGSLRLILRPPGLLDVRPSQLGGNAFAVLIFEERVGLVLSSRVRKTRFLWRFGGQI